MKSVGRSNDSFVRFLSPSRYTRNSLATITANQRVYIYIYISKEERRQGRGGFFKSLHKLDLQGSLHDPVCETLVKYRNTMKFPFALAPTIARAIRNSDKTLLKMLIFIERWLSMPYRDGRTNHSRQRIPKIFNERNSFSFHTVSKEIYITHFPRDGINHVRVSFREET